MLLFAKHRLVFFNSRPGVADYLLDGFQLLNYRLVSLKDFA